MNLFIRQQNHIKSLIILMISSTTLMAFQSDLGIYIQKARENNPSLKRAKTQWQSAEVNIAVAKGLANPTVSVGYFLESVETAAGPQQYKIGLTQKFPFLGKRKLQGKIPDGAVLWFRS